MIAVAPMLELVDVEGYTLALARQLVAVPVTAAPCPVAPRAAFGAHAVLPSAAWLTLPFDARPWWQRLVRVLGHLSPAERARGPHDDPGLAKALRSGTRDLWPLAYQAAPSDAQVMIQRVVILGGGTAGTLRPIEFAFLADW